jgi:putative aminopeptidase FrvX
MNINIKRVTEQIKELCLIPSPTGFTGHIETHLIALFKEMGFKPVKTKKGAVRVCIGGEGNPLLLSAHIDTVLFQLVWAEKS